MNDKNMRITLKILLDTKCNKNVTHSISGGLVATDIASSTFIFKFFNKEECAELKIISVVITNR